MTQYRYLNYSEINHWLIPFDESYRGFSEGKGHVKYPVKKGIINLNYNLIACYRNKDFLGIYIIIFHLFSIIYLLFIYWFYINYHLLCFLIFCIVYNFGVDIFLKLIHRLQNVKMRTLTCLSKGYTLPRNGYCERLNVDSSFL